MVYGIGHCIRGPTNFFGDPMHKERYDLSNHVIGTQKFFFFSSTLDSDVSEGTGIDTAEEEDRD